VNRFKRWLMRFLIPKGVYCDGCPFWFRDGGRPEQENGYCSYLKKGDWDLNEDMADEDFIVSTMDGDKAVTSIIKGRDFPFGMALLWDGCKECGVKW